MANFVIRREAKAAGVKLWELGDALGVSEATVTRLLRRELPDAERERLLGIIAAISERKQEEAAV